MHLVLYREIGKTDYKSMTDEDVVKMFNEGDTFALEYLISKYRNFVKCKAKSYYLIGGDREDIVQEGMIGLYKAILDYDINRLCSFRSFADICVTRQIITAIKTATRQKHIPLNSYVSLNKPIYDNMPNKTLIDVVIGARITNPESLIIGRENLKFMKEKIEDVLSDLELEVLTLYIGGMSYQEIAIEMNRYLKSIDNALQRIKRKLEVFLY